MLRQAFADRLKQALKAREARTRSTVCLMLAALRGGLLDFASAGVIARRLLGHERRDGRAAYGG